MEEIMKQREEKYDRIIKKWKANENMPDICESILVNPQLESYLLNEALKKFPPQVALEIVREIKRKAAEKKNINYR